MMSDARCHSAGLTLVEILISMVLIAVIATVATRAFTQMLTVTKRLQSRQTMDAMAKVVYEKLSEETSVMHPCAAVWLNAKDVHGSASVELVFMKGKLSPSDWPDTVHQWDTGSEMNFTDLLWTRWHWSESTRILSVSESRSGRWFKVNGNQMRNYWKIPGGSRMGSHPGGYESSFLAIPHLKRETGTSSQPNDPRDLLNENGWQSGEPGDVGDYDDLLLNARPLLFECSDLTIEMQTLAGDRLTASGDAPLQWAAPGSYVDGRDHVGREDRPGIIRIRFTISDPRLKTSNTYSFSCATPSLAPY